MGLGNLKFSILPTVRTGKVAIASQCIFPMFDGLQVIRVHAGSISAKVVDLPIIGNRTHEQLISHAMSIELNA